MQFHTIFITGGTSGIGRGLAEAFHQRGHRVIVTGRREDRLQEVCRANPGMRHFVLDVTRPEQIGTISRRAIDEFPDLDYVVNNSGIQFPIDLSHPDPHTEQALVEEISTNLFGPMRVAAAFLPHLASRPAATLVNVSSGLAFIPLARFPVYCATKAAVHSWTLSLRHQLRNSPVRVIELIPPYVATELGGADKPAPAPGAPKPMPLADFIREAMEGLESGAEEVAVDGAKDLVAAARSHKARAVFARMNG